MVYDIILSPEAVDDLRSLKARTRSIVREGLERHLRHEPTKESKSRIKRLRGLARPQFWLRLDEIRVFYDVKESAVEILAIVPKPEAEAWLEKVGEREWNEFHCQRSKTTFQNICGWLKRERSSSPDTGNRLEC